jgi:hypothetical protein
MSDRLATTVKREYPPQAPTINLNGTHGPDLYESLGRVVDALEDSLDALRRAAPNGRDYLTTNKLLLACNEHQRRAEVLTALIEEIQDERGLIIDQIP